MENNNIHSGETIKILNKPSRFVEVCLGIAIAILLNLLFNTIFGMIPLQSKNSITSYQEGMKKCAEISSESRNLVTKEMCLNQEGVWDERENYNKTTVVDGKEVQITGTCSLGSQYNQCVSEVKEDYPTGSSVYSSSRFSNPIKLYGGVGVGILLIVGSLFIGIFPLTLGFSLGGIFMLMSSTAKYWVILGDMGRLILFVMGLGILIFVAIKKFRVKK